MSATMDLRLEFTDLLESYLRGDTSISEYLTWEVEFTTSEDAAMDAGLTGEAGLLALLGQEYLMDLRPEDDFAQTARRFLGELQPADSDAVDAAAD